MPSSLPPYTRPQAGTLLQRLREPRRFLQALFGPRQAGKTTLVRQVLERLGLPHHYASADQPGLVGPGWVEVQWARARGLLGQGLGEALLVLDEIHKAPDWAEAVKRLWDEDTLKGHPLKVVLLTSAPLLLQKGLSESLAGRLETLPIPHWSFGEMATAFGYTLEDYLFFGGYPGAAPLRGEPDRFRRYIRDSLVEAALARDILLLSRIEKPALLRRLFHLACHHAGQVLSYTKMLGQLQERGNTVTLAHYLDLLEGAGLAAGLEKYAAQAVRRRASSPKLLIPNPALLTALRGLEPEDLGDPALRGRLLENAVGAHLWNEAFQKGFEVFYWRERNLEVDFVVRKGRRLLALEVKSGRPREAFSGLEAFRKAFGAEVLVVGTGGIPFEEFLARPLEL
ncbi:ATP-binding protein [Thermus oshimai]|uniref:ATP-binding protein n=1 Tax=Thermus oshimai TaxID=56957 RepID=UPI00035C950E|nr:ATP-binding protein [Thermus oshimai]